MAWKPSRDSALIRTQKSNYWVAIEEIYDIAVSLAPLPRKEKESLGTHYIIRLSFPNIRIR